MKPRPARSRSAVKRTSGNGVGQATHSGYVSEYTLKAMESPSPQEIYRTIRDEVWEFRDAMVKKWGMVNGKDRRSSVAHLIEQAGISVRDDMEREKREERDRAIRERQLTASKSLDQ